MSYTPFPRELMHILQGANSTPLNPTMPTSYYNMVSKELLDKSYRNLGIGTRSAIRNYTQAVQNAGNGLHVAGGASGTPFYTSPVGGGALTAYNAPGKLATNQNINLLGGGGGGGGGGPTPGPIPDPTPGGTPKVDLSTPALLGTGKVPFLSWNAKNGLFVKGKAIGAKVPLYMAVSQGINALSNISENGKKDQNINSLKNDIVTSAASNPLVSKYLTADQRKLLYQIRNSTYDQDLNDDVWAGVKGGFKDALINGAMGAIGGVPGIIVGAGGSLINSGIKGAGQGKEQEITRLQALYDALSEAEQSYQAMKRPVFTGLGIQHQYQNMYS